MDDKSTINSNYAKYIKYKTKYLSLKHFVHQIGGTNGNPETSWGEHNFNTFLINIVLVFKSTPQNKHDPISTDSDICVKIE